MHKLKHLQVIVIMPVLNNEYSCPLYKLHISFLEL